VTQWTSDELAAIGRAEELHIATERIDGRLRASLPIWVVRVGDEIVVRSANGRDGSWFRQALRTGKGRIQAGGVDAEVAFAETDAALETMIDEAFEAKYARYARNFLPPMLTAKARAAAITVLPR
jgi:hypothetical protein